MNAQFWLAVALFAVALGWLALNYIPLFRSRHRVRSNRPRLVDGFSRSGLRGW
jgi:hypothetical protein